MESRKCTAVGEATRLRHELSAKQRDLDTMGSLLEEHTNQMRRHEAQGKQLAEREVEVREREQELRLERDKLEVELRAERQRRLKMDAAGLENEGARPGAKRVADESVRELEKDLKQRDIEAEQLTLKIQQMQNDLKNEAAHNVGLREESQNLRS